eukprot:6207356-Pleurochrysis_carterae.AAC.2
MRQQVNKTKLKRNDWHHENNQDRILFSSPHLRQRVTAAHKTQNPIAINSMRCVGKPLRFRQLAGNAGKLLPCGVQCPLVVEWHVHQFCGAAGRAPLQTRRRHRTLHGS